MEPLDLGPDVSLRYHALQITMAFRHEHAGRLVEHAATIEHYLRNGAPAQQNAPSSEAVQ